MEIAEVLSGFRRRLVLRLLVVGILASVLAGASAYFIETERLDESLVDQAVLEARTLVSVLSLNADQAAPQRKLMGFLENHAATSRDFFVLAELYDGSVRSVGEASLPDFAFVESHFDRGRHLFPELGATWYTKEIIGGSAYLQVMVPLAGADGKAVGWFEGIYRLSPETLNGVQTDIMRILALTMGTVLMT